MGEVVVLAREANQVDCVAAAVGCEEEKVVALAEVAEADSVAHNQFPGCRQRIRAN